MKKLILILITTLITLCGCGQQEVAQYEELPPMAEIELTCDEAPGEEYIDTKVIASLVEDDGEKSVLGSQAEIKLRGNSSK
ncbi:MAG: hypothetical protein IJA50_01315, partial [Firmicutes bacterium]|nr:hypothetical protein [Bacillota bacterium]